MDQYISLTDENLDKLGLRTDAAMCATREYILSKFANSYTQIFQECMDRHTNRPEKTEKVKYGIQPFTMGVEFSREHLVFVTTDLCHERFVKTHTHSVFIN
jgi:hypothetical protein